MNRTHAWLFAAALSSLDDALVLGPLRARRADVVVAGPVLWHVVENFDDAFNRPPPGFDRDNWRLHGRGDWGRSGVRFLGTGGEKLNTPIPLVWSDGKQTAYQLVCRGEEGSRGDHRIVVERRP